MTPPGVLFSAGLDSAVLLADACARHGGAQPLYISAGLAWEPAERATAQLFVEALSRRVAVSPLVTLTLDMRDVYPPTHWAIRGEAPAYDTPDEDVYLEGRNIVLLSKAAVYAARAGISSLWLGPLAGNPFPDATPAFFSAMAYSLSLGLASPIAIETPFLRFDKSDVIRRGEELGVPWELTLSCMQPVDGLHCGRCSKCRERIDAFREAGVVDTATFASAGR